MSESEFGAPKVKQIMEAHEFRREVQRIKNPARKITFVCSECGSSQVEQRAWMKWNATKQEWYWWETCDEEDSTYCGDCGERGFGIDHVYQ